ncbi:acyltransferase family protein [Morganella morganii]|uniref:acyltransferase family protein n=1 Tax=Morganella morganii TaxID=582 RepID=UPI001BDB8758|nr:acyltransferase [Morganella morganii]MBT0498738.1 acyltransferase [Morganella morganii subsp. morganii]QWL98035.1 acyltransferase [Morganella morganii subsp. morganii]
MYSIAATASIFISFFITAYLFSKKNYLPHIDTSSIQKRYFFIDGLRGLAAVCVVVGHSWRIGAKWIDLSSYPIISGGLIAAIGVQIFFCITGFLFIDQVIKRQATFNWMSFFKSRIKRLVPLFIVSTTICVFIIYCENIYSIMDITKRDIVNTIKLYTFGFFGGGVVTINGVDSSLLTIMHWTLPFEWKFYFSIPFLCLACILIKNKSFITIFIFFCIITYIFNGFYFGKWFLTGCFSAIIFNATKTPEKKYRAFISIVGVMSLVPLFIVKENAYGMLNFICVSVFFLSVIISKPTLLKEKTLIYIGESSYSIYLNHTIIMFVVPLILFLINGVIVVDNAPVALLILALTSLIISSVSFLSFKNIEEPFLRKK